jgi:hypothetical protein
VNRPDLEPNHGEGEYARYSDFFDLDYLSNQTQVGIAEWQDVKTTNRSRLTEPEHVGCWGEGVTSEPLSRYATETSFWPVPIQLRTKFGVEPTLTFSGIETIDARNETVTRWLDAKVKEWFGTVENSPPLPNQHLLCFHNLFYTSSVNLTAHKFVEGQKGTTIEVEGLEKESEIWLKVGQYLRFTPRIDHLVDEMLETLLGDSHSPFIAIHLRQGDFLKLGRATNETDKIKTKYSDGLDELQTKLLKLPALAGIDVDRLPVLLATDSTDEVLLAELRRMKWILIDHEQLDTRVKYGSWYPGLLDSAILSRAVGLVGYALLTLLLSSEQS